MLNPKLVFVFPTCQVRVSRSRFYRYYQSWPARLCQLRLCFNCELRSSVGTGGPQPRAPDLSGHWRTSTASARSQWALPDLNGKRQSSVGIAGHQRQAPELSGYCRTSTARARSQWALWDPNCECKMLYRISDRMSEEMSDRLPDRMSEKMSE